MAPVQSEHDLFLMLAYFYTHSLEGLSDSFSQGFETFHPVSGSILQGIEPRLKDFHQLLLQPPKVWGFSSAPLSGLIPARWPGYGDRKGWRSVAAMTLSKGGGAGTRTRKEGGKEEDGEKEMDRQNEEEIS